MTDQLNESRVLEMLGEAMKPLMESIQTQQSIEEYPTSPEIVEAIARKEDELIGKGKDRAYNLYSVLDDLGPYNVISYAFTLYYKARNNYFKAREQSDRSAMNVVREQEQGSKTGEEVDNTFNPEIPSELSRAEWWLEIHNKNMDLAAEMCYAAASLVELANIEIRDQGKDANAFITVDLSEKAFADFKSRADSERVTKEDRQRTAGIRALQIDRDTRLAG